MLGRDYAKTGDERFIQVELNKGDSVNGYLYRGPIRVVFLNRSTLAIIDKNNEVHVQNLSGNVSVILCNETTQKNQELEKQKQLEMSKANENNDDDDIYGKFLNGNKTTKKKEIEKVQETAYNFIDVTASDLCLIPLTKNIAITDMENQHIKIINTNEWYLDRILSKRGSNPGEIFNASGIDCFKLGYDVFYCVCELGCNRIQILSEGFKPILNLGCHGSLPYQFKEPVSIAAHCPFKIDAKQVKSKYYPKWYIGQRDNYTDCEERLYDDGQIAGNFYVSERIDDPILYDLVYFSHDFHAIKSVLKRVYDDEDIPTGPFKMCIASTAEDGGPFYPSLWDLIKAQKHLKNKANDPRPYVNIAVAEREGFRVQIFKYYWTKSEIFIPTIELSYTIGGFENLLFELKSPSCVAYSSTGELALCDIGQKKVFLLTRYMGLIKCIDTSFKTKISSEFLTDHNSLQSKEKSKIDRFATKKYENITFEYAKQVAVIDNACNSVSFSPDGKLAVGYKEGGVIVHGAYKSYDIGYLDILTLEIFFHILSYNNYDDIIVLRNSCRYLHKLTFELRNRWKISPLRPNKFNTSVYLFVKFGRFVDDSDSKIYIDYCKDCDNKPICKKYLNEACNDKYCPNSHGLLVYEREELANIDLVMTYKSFLVVVSQIFGPKYLWKVELYIKELFREFAIDREDNIQRIDKDKRVEELRDILCQETMISTKLLSYFGYCEVLTVLEEDFQNCKSIHLHTFFCRKNKSSFIPADPYTIESEEVKLYHDPKVQYDRGIDVPYTMQKSKRIITIKGMEDVRRGTNLSQVKQYNNTFESAGDKAGDLINKFFK